MTIHVDPTHAERASAAARFQFQGKKLRRQDAGLRWGKAPTMPRGASLKALNSPHFDPANAPAGARLVPFSLLERGECQWGFTHGETNIFCGAPVDPAAKGTRLFQHYCRHHVKAAKGRTINR